METVSLQGPEKGRKLFPPSIQLSLSLWATSLRKSSRIFTLNADKKCPLQTYSASFTAFYFLPRSTFGINLSGKLALSNYGTSIRISKHQYCCCLLSQHRAAILSSSLISSRREKGRQSSRYNWSVPYTLNSSLIDTLANCIIQTRPPFLKCTGDSHTATSGLLSDFSSLFESQTCGPTSRNPAN